MILGVPGIDLALTQRLVPLSGPHKEKKTDRLIEKGRSFVTHHKIEMVLVV